MNSVIISVVYSSRSKLLEVADLLQIQFTGKFTILYKDTYKWNEEINFSTETTLLPVSPHTSEEEVMEVVRFIREKGGETVTSLSHEIFT